jgi:hypothetical protein
MGGGSVIVWTGFSADGRCNLKVFDGSIKAVHYQQALQEHFLPFRDCFREKFLVLQRDNASVHTANSTKQWVQEHNIQEFEWPSNSPDLNPMENVWSILVKRVYADGRQFNSKIELTRAINEAWQLISQVTLEGLITGMPSRVFDVIQANGGSTDY